jgi:hypothetical protein
MPTTLNPLLIPGSVIQVVHAQLPAPISAGNPSTFSATPLITEGAAIMSIVITPKYATSTMLVEAKINNGRRGVAGVSYVAIFRNGTVGARCAESSYSTATEFDMDLYQSFTEVAGTTSAITYSSRIANPTGSGTVFVSATAWTAPTKQASWMRVTEVAA